MSPREVNFFHPLEFPKARLAGNLFLAPLAGYTDLAFRAVALRRGASFTCTEMISAEAIARGNTKTFRLAKRAPEEKLYGIQIFTGDYRSALLCGRALLPFRPAFIDLNCGCSVPKILKSGAGARLLLEPKKIGEIIRALHEELPFMLSVKLRSGWDSNTLTYLDAAGEAVNNGAVMVSLHPRTRAQGFTGCADLSHLKSLKASIAVPVIGSGDLFSPEDAQRMFARTGCDGVMFARGAIGNPFIFSRTRALFEDGRLPPDVQASEKLETALEQLLLMCGYKSEPIACREMRKHFAHYVRGLSNAADLRRAVNHAESVADYKKIIGSVRKI